MFALSSLVSCCAGQGSPFSGHVSPRSEEITNCFVIDQYSDDILMIRIIEAIRSVLMLLLLSCGGTIRIISLARTMNVKPHLIIIIFDGKIGMMGWWKWGKKCPGVNFESSQFDWWRHNPIKTSVEWQSPLGPGVCFNVLMCWHYCLLWGQYQAAPLSGH